MIFSGGDIMLINYRFGNFRSFKDHTTLSMRATPQTTYNDNLIREQGLRILPSAVIYGSNASGKSNIILSLVVFRNIIVSGTIESNAPGLANLELLPFAHDDDNDPICFGAEFITDDIHFDYNLEIAVSKLRRGSRSVVHERLSVIDKNKERVLFARDEKSVTIPTDKKTLEYLKVSDTFVREISPMLNNNMDSAELFLTRGFKSAINGALADSVIHYFEQNVIALNNFSIKSAQLNVKIEGNDDPKPIAIWNNVLEAFIRGADFGPQSIHYESSTEDGDSSDMELYSTYRNTLIPAELMESRGTLKLLDFALLFQAMFEKGGLFVIDEFDSALHSEIVKGILSLFNNREINTGGAQLIFTTHNPIYLNNRIFRRDQIIFVEKDQFTFRSALYTLADFGSQEVRNDENYLLNYVKGKYGPLPYIDFSALLRKYEEG